MIRYFKEIQFFQRNYFVIIIEWKKTEEIYLLTEENKLLLINKKNFNFFLNFELQKKDVYLATLSFSDEFSNHRYTGDAYWNLQKNRYVALLWRYGNSGMILPKRSKKKY